MNQCHVDISVKPGDIVIKRREPLEGDRGWSWVCGIGLVVWVDHKIGWDHHWRPYRWTRVFWAGLQRFGDGDCASTTLQVISDQEQSTTLT